MKQLKKMKKRLTTRNAGLLKTLLVCLLIALPFVVLPSLLMSGKLNAQTESRTGAIAVPPSKHPHPLSSTARTRRQAANHLPAGLQVGYDPTVLLAMKEMGITVDEFDAWIEEHPGTTLRHVKYMPDYMQKDVASTALFIRKSNNRIDPETSWREASALVHYSGKYGIPSALATAVAHTESTFDPNAVSNKGASGVMQVMWRFHNQLLQANGIVPADGSNPLADPEQAIAAGCLLLSRYLRAYGSVTNAMERYYGARSLAYQRKIDRTIARILDHQAELYQ